MPFLEINKANVREKEIEVWVQWFMQASVQRGTPQLLIKGSVLSSMLVVLDSAKNLKSLSESNERLKIENEFNHTDKKA